MRFLKQSAGLLAGLAVSLAAMAEGDGAGLRLYPVKGVFYPVMADGSPTRIDQDFRDAVEKGVGAAFFEKRFREEFPDAASTIDDRNKRRTFAVSLQVARAAHYEVPKPNGTVDVYLPLSASLYFTNVMTGEVLYTSTRTDIKMATLAGKPDPARVRQLFLENFQELAGDLIRTAKGQFHPARLTATIRAEWKGLQILDKGFEQGVAKDDSLLDDKGNELRVISAGPDYAVARLELGQAARGASFAKVSNQTLSDIKKPRAMVLVSQSPAGYPPEVLTQLLSDALGAKAGVSIVAVNRSFANVLQVLSNDTGLSQQQLRSRELPDYFVRLKVPEVVHFEAPTNLGHVTRRTYATQALAEFVDKDGRVLVAGIGRDQIVDEVIAGISFDRNSRREVVMKNALTDLSNRLAQTLKFRHTELPVSPSGDTVSLKDDQGILVRGKDAVAYRSIGKIDGIAGDVRVPIWILDITDVKDGVASAVPSLPLIKDAPPLAPGDMVLIDSVATPLPVTRQRLGACAPVAGQSDKLGSIDLPGFNDLALNVFAGNFSAPYFVTGFAEQLNQVVRAGAGFKSDLKLTDKPLDYCVDPVYRVDAEGEFACPPGESCGQAIKVRLTYRVRQGADIKARHGLEITMTSASLPAEVSVDTRAKALHLDLVDEVLKLTPQIIPKFATDAF